MRGVRGSGVRVLQNNIVITPTEKLTERRGQVLPFVLTPSTLNHVPDPRVRGVTYAGSGLAIQQRHRPRLLHLPRTYGDQGVTHFIESTLKSKPAVAANRETLAVQQFTGAESLERLQTAPCDLFPPQVRWRAGRHRGCGDLAGDPVSRPASASSKAGRSLLRVRSGKGEWQQDHLPAANVPTRHLPRVSASLRRVRLRPVAGFHQPTVSAA